MPTLADYLDAARNKLPSPSDYALAEALGLERQSLTNYRRRGQFPGLAVMHKLAGMTDTDPFVAFVDLLIWKAKKANEPDVVALLEARREGLTKERQVTTPSNVPAITAENAA